MVNPSPRSATMPMDEKHRIDIPDLSYLHFEAPYFQAIFDAPVPVMIVREDGKLLLVNRVFEEITGYTAEMIPTFADWVAHQQGPADDARRRIASYFEIEKTLSPFQICVETRSGESLVWEILNSPLGRTDDGDRLIISIASDITGKIDYQQHLETVANQLEDEVCKRTEALNRTIEALQGEIDERKRMSEALNRSTRRLKNLSLRTLTILEADRQNISKELHDRVGASLAAIKFSLEDKEIKRAQSGG